MTLKKLSLLGFTIILCSNIYAQKDSSWLRNCHFQLTSIMQGHPAFNAPYSGPNSLSSSAEQALSVTSTLFLGAKLWEGASVYFNPEIAGGRGISSALGIAGFTNGECFRIGNPEPAVYVARAYIKQYISLSKDYTTVADDKNQVEERVPDKRITITAGKFSIADMFDNNSYSHDPRSQFLNWSLMNNGDWDYPANTRHYTYGILVENAQPTWAIRVAGTLVGKVANGPEMDWNIGKVNAGTAEYQRNYLIKKRVGIVRLLVFNNTSRAGNYTNAINQFHQTGDSSALNVNSLSAYNGSKNYGYGINIEHHLTDDIGFFARTTHNDGHTATCAFTEIDEHYSAGITITGARWKSAFDAIGIATLANGISPEHRAFLNTGGTGFIIGDGMLPHYSREFITETYYSFRLNKNLYFSVDYQFVKNPAYNADRGPVSVWALRGHVEF